MLGRERKPGGGEGLGRWLGGQEETEQGQPDVEKLRNVLEREREV